jgi:hypothetical protein
MQAKGIMCIIIEKYTLFNLLTLTLPLLSIK